MRVICVCVSVSRVRGEIYVPAFHGRQTGQHVMQFKLISIEHLQFELLSRNSYRGKEHVFYSTWSETTGVTTWNVSHVYIVCRTTKNSMYTWEPYSYLIPTRPIIPCRQVQRTLQIALKWCRATFPEFMYSIARTMHVVHIYSSWEMGQPSHLFCNLMLSFNWA